MRLTFDYCLTIASALRSFTSKQENVTSYLHGTLLNTLLFCA